ncbi:MMPL family protein [Mycobacteroides abscessus MAB_030201_1061]|nr:MMPL family protein [Mycobacteroides abscessus MAB_030201_1061]
MLLTIAAALTLGPALLHLGSLFGLFDPKRRVKARLYRRIGASVVRWPSRSWWQVPQQYSLARCLCRHTK